MRGLRGVFAGALALIALETIVSTREAAGRVGGLLGDVSAIVTRLLDPTVAAIPDVAGVYTGNQEPPSWGGLKPPKSAPQPTPEPSAGGTTDPQIHTVTGRAKPPKAVVVNA